MSRIRPITAGRATGPVLRGLAIIGLALLLNACATRIAARGNIPDADLLAQIKPGEYSREEIAELIGSPSSVALFDQETWYYVSERTETFAFMPPEVLDRKVVIMKFDADGILTKMESVGLPEAKKVKPVDRRTPTVGDDLGFLEQVLGNIGRFEGKK